MVSMTLPESEHLRATHPRQGGNDPLEPPGPAPSRAWPGLLRRWIQPVTLAAAGVSLAIHLVLWAVAGMVTIGGAQAGGAATSQDAIDLAILTDAELGETPAALFFEDVMPAPTDLPIGELEMPDAAPEFAPGAGGGSGDSSLPGEELGALMVGAGAGNLTGEGLGLGGGGGGAARFFGVEAQGNRFAYIVDVSGSMSGAIDRTGRLTRLDVLKRELTRSIEALLENASFLVVTFSSLETTYPLGKRREWTSAGDAGRQWARAEIACLTANGATEPVRAFQIVLSMRPRPDAIYFMTDGEFDPKYAHQIISLNTVPRVPVHCITLISRDGEQTMRRIAEETGGTYTHIPGPDE